MVGVALSPPGFLEGIFLWGLIKKDMNVDDALLVLLLAEKIHGTDEGVRRAAKNILKKLPRGRRNVIYELIASKSPLGVVRYIAKNIDDQTRNRLASS